MTFDLVLAVHCRRRSRLKNTFYLYCLPVTEAPIDELAQYGCSSQSKALRHASLSLFKDAEIAILNVSNPVTSL